MSFSSHSRAIALPRVSGGIISQAQRVIEHGLNSSPRKQDISERYAGSKNFRCSSPRRRGYFRFQISPRLKNGRTLFAASSPQVPAQAHQQGEKPKEVAHQELL